VGEIADGVVVGSAVVARQTDPEAVGELVGEIADAL
jgi:tryptophan synthase alpha subunit